MEITGLQSSTRTCDWLRRRGWEVTGKTEVLVEESVPVPLCPPQILTWTGRGIEPESRRCEVGLSVIMIPPMSQTHPHVNNIRTLKRKLGTCKRGFALSDMRGRWREKYVYIANRV